MKSSGAKLFNNGSHCLVIAEISANHGQNFKQMVALINKAKECGVDAIKFQTYTPDSLTIDVDNKYFRISQSKWKAKTLYELYEKAHTPWRWFKNIKKICADLNIPFFSTAFDKKGVDLLEGLDVPFHKISSFEIVDLPLIEYIAKTKKPLFISTGMASLDEIKTAVKTAKQSGAKEIILLKCVSSYPASPKEMNLITIPHMEKIFRCPVGLSDHTLGVGVAIAAVTLGARVIEKHFTLSRKFKSADSFFSMEPGELKLLVENIRVVEESLGKVKYGVTEGEKESQVYRRSLFFTEDLKKGEMLTEDNTRSIRPAYGLSPKYYKAIIGKKRAKVNIQKGTPLSWKVLL